MKKLILSTALALAGIASASAQTITPGADDLILSFTQTGNTNNFEVDLGAASNFDQGNPLASGSTYFFTTAAGALNADLSSIYGSNWATVGNVSWNVAGVADVNSDLFSTAQSSTLLKVSGSIATPSGKVRGIANLLNNGGNGQAAFGSDDVGVEVSTTTAGSFTNENTTGNFGALKNNSANAKDTIVASGTSTSMDLFYFDPSQAGFESDLGTFKLSSNGTFSFGTQAVPEPSTYALGICGMILFAVLLRRKSMRA